MKDEFGSFELPLDMSLRWGATYDPQSFSLKPVFVTDWIVWPIPPCGHRNYCDCDTIRMEAEST